MEKDYKKLLRLSQVVNSSFGTDGPGFQHVNGMNVKLSTIDSGLLKAKCIMSVTYSTDQLMRERQRRHRDTAIAMIQGAIDRAKDEYESKFDEKINFEFNPGMLEESNEFVSVSSYSGVTRGYYRATALIKVK